MADTVLIRFRFFASVREQIGTDSGCMETTARNVAELCEEAVRHHPEWAVIASDQTCCAVNQLLCDRDQPISHGDEVAFFPFMTGG